MRLTKKIHLAQLTSEIGGIGLSLRDDELTAHGDISEANLKAAVDAHVPNPDFGKPTEDVEMSKVREKAKAVAAGTDTFTAAQVQKILAHLVLRATR